MDTVPSEGRFLVLADQYLDPHLYQGGKKITVAGELIGETIQSVGEMDYRYPLLSSKQIYLWPEYYYYRYAYDYYDPWVVRPIFRRMVAGSGFSLSSPSPSSSPPSPLAPLLSRFLSLTAERGSRFCKTTRYIDRKLVIISKISGSEIYRIQVVI